MLIDFQQWCQKPFNGKKKNGLFKNETTGYTRSKKMNTNFMPYKNYSKWIKDQYIRNKSQKILEDIIGVNIFDLGLGGDILNHN